MLSPDNQDDHHDIEDFPSMNLIPPLLGLIGIGVFIYIMSAFGSPPGFGNADLSHCAGIADGRARLVCYDQVIHLNSPAKGAFAPARSPENERR